MKRKIFLAVALLAASPALGAIRWRGDFETGDLSQWTKAQAVAADRLTVVRDPVRQGSYALKVVVRQGDDPINASGNRGELVDTTYQPEGSEAYYRWSTLFDPSFPSVPTWQLFAQWHQIEDSGSPPMELYVYGEELRFRLAQRQVWRAPLVRGVWHDFVLHVKFSDDPRRGFVELWHQGEKVLPKTYAATRANDYLKLGLYRDDSIQPVGILFHDGMIKAERLEDVLPSSPAPSSASSSPSSPWAPDAPSVETVAWSAVEEPEIPPAGEGPREAPPRLPDPRPLPQSCGGAGAQVALLGLFSPLPFSWPRRRRWGRS